MEKFFGKKRLLRLLKHSVSCLSYPYCINDFISYEYFLGTYPEFIRFSSCGFVYDLCCYHEIDYYCLVFHVYTLDKDNLLVTLDGFRNYYSFNFRPELSKGVELFGLLSSGDEIDGIELFNFSDIEKYFLCGF